VGLLQMYLNLNILLTVGAGLSIFITLFSEATFFNISAQQKVRLHFAILSVCVLATIVLPLLPEKAFTRPLPQAFQTSLEVVSLRALPPAKNFGESPKTRPQSPVGASLAGFFVLTLLCLFVKALVQLRRTLFRLKRSYHFKRVGRIQVVVSETEQVPYAFSFLRQSYISLPVALLGDLSSFRIAIQHEAQHIRQGDTATVYLLELISGLCFWNPAIRLWIGQILVEQEFSCDEALIVHRKVSPRDYASCLFEVAQLREVQEKRPFGATGLIFKRSRSLLIRRIEKMKNKEQKSKGFVFGLSMAIASVVFIGLTAIALKSFASGKNLSIEKISSLVHPSDFSKGFPVEINEAVVAELNKLVGTHRGKAFVKKALVNYQAHQRLLKSFVKKYGLPEEVLAVGFIESGFQNLPQSKHPVQSAGLWQFIPDTARNYNLRVDKQVDDRMNVPLQTDAAMRYLEALHLRFQDWPLALLSYNAGEARVQKGIHQTQQRDAWAVIDAGFGGDKGYLAKVMAGAIIMKYPALLAE